MAPTPTSAPRTDRATGFTLVEVLVSLVVLAVVAVMLGQALRGSLRVHALQRREPEEIRGREERMGRQLAGELKEPVLSLREVNEP